MTVDDLKMQYGDEYPAAVVVDGIRIPLFRESRFMRDFGTHEDKSQGVWISRFMDGSASITAPELMVEWPTWTEELRSDFCRSCVWLHEQSDFPDMLRFIMKHGGRYNRPAVALSVASTLPLDEAFGLLLEALHTAEIGGACVNFCQAIAQTNHPDAKATLRQHLQAVWAHEKLWNDDPFNNWVAFDATCCIQFLLELGVLPAEFEEQVRRLSQHVCLRNHDCCRGYLGKHYPWLK